MPMDWTDLPGWSQWDEWYNMGAAGGALIALVLGCLIGLFDALTR